MAEGIGGLLNILESSEPLGIHLVWVEIYFLVAPLIESRLPILVRIGYACRTNQHIDMAGRSKEIKNKDGNWPEGHALRGFFIIHSILKMLDACFETTGFRRS